MVGEDDGVSGPTSEEGRLLGGLLGRQREARGLQLGGAS